MRLDKLNVVGCAKGRGKLQRRLEYGATVGRQKGAGKRARSVVVRCRDYQSVGLKRWSRRPLAQYSQSPQNQLFYNDSLKPSKDTALANCAGRGPPYLTEKTPTGGPSRAAAHQPSPRNLQPIKRRRWLGRYAVCSR